jgi:hypothetical protein
MLNDIKKMLNKLTVDEQIIFGSVIVVFLLFSFGGDTNNKEKTEVENIEVKNFDVDIDNGMNIYCDQKKNVEYLIFKDYKGVTMSKRYNEDNSVSNCVKPFLEVKSQD